MFRLPSLFRRRAGSAPGAAPPPRPPTRAELDLYGALVGRRPGSVSEREADGSVKPPHKVAIPPSLLPPAWWRGPYDKVCAGLPRAWAALCLRFRAVRRQLRIARQRLAASQNSRAARRRNKRGTR